MLFIMFYNVNTNNGTRFSILYSQNKIVEVDRLNRIRGISTALVANPALGWAQVEGIRVLSVRHNQVKVALKYRDGHLRRLTVHALPVTSAQAPNISLTPTLFDESQPQIIDSGGVTGDPIYLLYDGSGHWDLLTRKL
jgi:hypothetical protein